MTVPTSSGQIACLRRARHAKAGFSPATVSLLRSARHGNRLGRSRRVESGLLFSESGAAPGSVRRRIGQSLIGHTKGAAGVAGMIKARWRLHYKVLPPSCRCGESSARAARGFKPGLHARGAVPWVDNPSHPRRAAVSAFRIRRRASSCGDRGIFRRGGPGAVRRRGLAV